MKSKGREESRLPPGEGARRAGEGRGARNKPNQESKRARTHVRLDPELLHFIRKPREQQTDPERLLWYILRGRRLAGAKFRRQYLIEPFVIDFYCHDLKLAIELDGGQHNSPEMRSSDERRNQFLAARGIRVLRFWNHEVREELDSIVEAIANAIDEARARKAT